jgi:hypothetical protein
MVSEACRELIDVILGHPAEMHSCPFVEYNMRAFAARRQGDEWRMSLTRYADATPPGPSDHPLSIAWTNLVLTLRRGPDSTRPARMRALFEDIAEREPAGAFSLLVAYNVSFNSAVPALMEAFSDPDHWPKLVARAAGDIGHPPGESPAAAVLAILSEVYADDFPMLHALAVAYDVNLCDDRHLRWAQDKTFGAALRPFSELAGVRESWARRSYNMAVHIIARTLDITPPTDLSEGWPLANADRDRINSVMGS